MNAYERLEDEACRDGIDIVRRKFNSPRIKGLYCNGTVAINDDIETSNESACVLAEELGHHYTTVGNILDLSDAQNRKQERQARLWAYNKRIGLYGLIRAFEHGCRTRHETAEYLEVTEEFLQDAIECYRDKYGTGTAFDGYYIMFVPNLMIGKII
jgi:hypothetical protein